MFLSNKFSPESFHIILPCFVEATIQLSRRNSDNIFQNVAEFINKTLVQIFAGFVDRILNKVFYK